MQKNIVKQNVIMVKIKIKELFFISSFLSTKIVPHTFILHKCTFCPLTAHLQMHSKTNQYWLANSIFVCSASAIMALFEKQLTRKTSQMTNERNKNKFQYNIIT